ncbi:MAG: hypothetical protein Q9167_004174 [Letrouitia subvulpina]
MTGNGSSRSKRKWEIQIMTGRSYIRPKGKLEIRIKARRSSSRSKKKAEIRNMAGNEVKHVQNPPTLNESMITGPVEPLKHPTKTFKIDHRVTRCSFFKLPLELRNQIYHEYLEAQYTAQDDLIYETKIFEQELALLHVSRQIYLELRQLLVSDKVIRVRISWQGWNFHPLSVLSNNLRLHSNASRIDLEKAACVQVNVYAPHNKRLTDLICIWQYSHMFCDKLKDFAEVKRLVIVLMESGRDQALSDDDRKELDWSWSRPKNPGLPKRSLEKYEHLYFDKIDQLPLSERWTDEYDSTDDEANSDLKYIIDQFSLLTNVKDVHIELPLSLRNNSRLQDMVSITKDMMSMHNPPVKPERNRRGMMKMLFTCAKSLWLETGKNSKQRLKELDSSLEGLSEREMYLFQEVWPHLCCIRRYQKYKQDFDWESWSDELYPLWPCIRCQDDDDFELYQYSDICLDLLKRLGCETFCGCQYELSRLNPYYPVWKTELLQKAAIMPIEALGMEWLWKEHYDRKPRWPHSTDFSDLSQHCRELLENIQ